ALAEALGYRTRRSPGAFAGRSFFAFPVLGYFVCLHGRVSQSGARPLRKSCSSVHVIVRNAPEKIVRISGEKIVAHYTTEGACGGFGVPMTQHDKGARQFSPMCLNGSGPPTLSWRAPDPTTGPAKRRSTLAAT